jgi:hypothetical protein
MPLRLALRVGLEEGVDGLRVGGRDLELAGDGAARRERATEDLLADVIEAVVHRWRRT